MNSNEKLLHEIIRRQIYLERYKNGAVAGMQPILNRAIIDVRNKIAKLGNNATKAHLKAVLREVIRINDEMSEELNDQLEKELKRLAKSDAVWTTAAIEAAAYAKTIGISIGVPSDALLERMVTSNPYQGLTLKEWTQRVGQSASLKAKQQLFIGMAEGEDIDKIVKRFNFIGEQSKNDLRMVVRTSVNAVANQAKSLVYAENADVLQAVMWKATLDSRTSLICASRDGTQYPLDKHPTPPAHPNCRSVLVPIIKSLEELGLGNRRLPVGTRASMDGQVPADMNFDQWLRKQPKDFVEDYLGPSRAKLYYQNKLTLDKFVNDEGRTLTLEQLDAIYN